jgi:hypothetical protein
MKQFNKHGALLLLALAWTSACGDDGGEKATPPATNEEVAALLGAGPGGTGSCSVASCHGSAAEAELDITKTANLRELFVGVPACEAPGFDLVEPGDPERSWLWIKLTGEREDGTTGELKADPSWGEPNPDCKDAGGFGWRMPRVAPFELKQSDLDKIRSWIEAGAPGPDGTQE